MSRSFLVVVALPILQPRSRHLGAFLAQFGHLFLSHGLKLLRYAHVVFNLADRGAAKRKAVDWQAKDVGQSFRWIFESSPAFPVLFIR